MYLLEVLQKVGLNVCEEKILSETRKYEKLQYIVKYKHDQDVISRE